VTRYEAQADIARSADEVWSYAADILHHPDWMAVSSARVLSGDGGQVGARGVARQVLGPIQVDIEFEVAEAEPGRRLQWRSTDPRFDYVVTLDLEPLGQADSRARYTAAIGLHGVWRLLSPLVALEGEKSFRAELESLKSRVESGAAMAVATAS
jgi:uncharacterized membrane protein